MIEKFFDPFVKEGEAPVVPLFEHGDSMTKVASYLDELPRLQEYINKASPEKGWYIVLIHANGIDEVWGDNRKGDCFPKIWLAPSNPKADYGYTTFETMANGYVHHRNTPDKWTGRVLMAEYNPLMGRVELIAKFNKQRLLEEGTPYFVEMLERGELPAVSMGCRVPYDICSICGNKAPTTMQYCDHLRFQRRMILPDGRKVKMLNVEPRFHDISLVSTPADPAARVLLKVASSEEGEKLSYIQKRSPVQSIGSLKRLSKEDYVASIRTSGDPDIDFETLVALARHHKHAAYSALTTCGILLRPHEFAAIEYMRKADFHKAAEIYASRGQFPVHDYRGSGFFSYSHDKDLSRSLSKYIPDRSIYIPAVQERAEHMKTASALEETRGNVEESIIEKYAGYRKEAEELLLSGRAIEQAYNDENILNSALKYGISLTMKLASLNEPKEVFSSFVRGAYLPTIV